MKKSIAVLLCLLLVGCFASNDEQTQNDNKYNEFKNRIIANNGKDSYDFPFQYLIELVDLKDGTYAYTIVVDQVSYAIYDIEMIALDVQRVQDDKMEANLGLLSSNSISLVPNQVYVDKGYPKEIELHGVSEVDTFSIYVGITFHEEDQKESTLFYSFYIKDGKQVVEEVSYE